MVFPAYICPRMRTVGNNVFLRHSPRTPFSLIRRDPQLLRNSLCLSQRRHASTAATDTTSLATRLKNFAFGTSIVLTFVLGYFYITDTRASIHRYIVVPAIRLIYTDAEDAHHFGNAALKALYQFGLHPRERSDPDKAGDLTISVFGHTLVNPIATSGGLDKDAAIPNPLFAIGPAIVEVGGATPLPQQGNPKPRVFRLPSQDALINRYGLNSLGADNMAVLLRHRVREYARSVGYGYDALAEQRVLDGEAEVPPGSLMPGRLMAVQIAKNKATPESDVEAVKADYVYCVNRLARYADILVVNVSSPNTPGLRSLQATEPLTKILTGVVEAAKKVDRKVKPAVMVKVSPDEDSDEQISGICEAVWESGVDGVIVGNTTKKRPNPLPVGYQLGPLEEQILLEQGGYSGPQLFDQTVTLVKRYRSLLDLRPTSASAQGNPPPGTPQTRSEEPSKLTVVGVEKPKNESLSKIGESIETQTIPLHDISDLPKSEKSSIFRLPERHKSSSPDQAAPPSTYTHSPPTSQSASESPKMSEPATSASPSTTSSLLPTSASSPSPNDESPKVIFATGGITTGKQALEVINAGASVAMIYTALVYGGVGTVSRIKDEMRQDIKAG